MRELRLSIPFVGGVTAVFTQEEVDIKKAAAKKHIQAAVVSIKSFAKRCEYNVVNVCEPALARVCEYSNNVLADK